MSFILYGKEINSDIAETSECKILAQLCIFNAKKKQNVQNNNQRKNLAREPPIPIYLGLSIHMETRVKKLTKNLYQLRLSISYFGHNITKTT